MSEPTIAPHATMGGAFKGYIESLGLGLPVYRDGAPRDAAGALSTSWPFVVVQEGIGYTADRHGDDDDEQAHLGTTELVQVDLWQRAREQIAGTARTRVAEDYRLPERVEAALRRRSGLAPHSPWRVYGVSLFDSQRYPISDNQLRHTWTVRVRRDTERIT